MSPETRRQLKDDLARARHEREAFRARARQRRLDYLDLRKKRRFLESLQALDRYHEYRATAAQYDAEAKRLRALLTPTA